MKNRLPLVALLALGACQAGADAPASGAEEARDFVAVSVFDVSSFTGTSYGEPLTLTEVTAVSTILDDPAGYLGKRVLVQGMVVEVCEERGCWMDIASDRDFEKIQVKVDDGVIVFPLTARGKQALVEGVVEQLELTYEQAVEDAKHKAEELGTVFDSSTVTGPVTVFRIRGVGAIVAD